MRENNQMFQEDVILKIMTQMCLAIKALHSLRIMHRDLKVSSLDTGVNFVIRVRISSCLMIT